jgi:hypothetical protein
MREPVGVFDSEWHDTHGMVARIKRPLAWVDSSCPFNVPTLEAGQNDRLWISDPKAIQYILQTSRYSFVRSYDVRFALNAATGRGVNGAEGLSKSLLFSLQSFL